MKLPAVLRSITLVEIVVLLLFILYIVFPVPVPRAVGPYIESPIGMILILAVLVFLFIYSNPILAVLFIFVGYELLRRSAGPKGSVITSSLSSIISDKPVIAPKPVVKATEIPSSLENGPNNAYLQYTQASGVKESNLEAANIPIMQPTLEEAVVQEKAPVGKSEMAVYTANSFKPVSDNLHGASTI